MQNRNKKKGWQWCERIDMMELHGTMTSSCCMNSLGARTWYFALGKDKWRVPWTDDAACCDLSLITQTIWNKWTLHVHPSNRSKAAGETWAAQRVFELFWVNEICWLKCSPKGQKVWANSAKPAKSTMVNGLNRLNMSHHYILGFV